MKDPRSTAGLYARLFDMAADAMIVHQRGTILQVNQAACDALGYTRDELEAMHIRDLEAWFDRHHLEQHWERMSRNVGVSFKLNGRHRRKDGSTFPVEINACLIDVDGERVTLAVVRDMSERERLMDQIAARSAELERALQHNQAILDHMDDGLVAVDPDGAIAVVNPAFHRLFQLGDTVTEGTLAAIGLIGLGALVDQAIVGHEVVRADVPLPGGRQGAAVASAIRSAAGALLGAVVLVRDVSLEREIDQMKTEFTTMVTHELRTPMTSVLGFARLTRARIERALQYVPDSDERAVRAAEAARNNLDIIVSEGERLTALINDVLDIAKMESGRMEWTRAPAAPDGLVQRAAAATASLFGEGDAVQLTVDVGDGLPTVDVDADRVIQVLINLVSNARKFTAAGEVRVEADARDGGVEFRVRDTGIGIDPANLDAVFEKFKQVGDHRAGGTGLGLPICREIVAAHDGRIWADSTPGQGSTFAFWVPSA